MPRIAQIVVGLPIEGPFDYSVPPQFQADIAVGQRVLVHFRFRPLTGYVVALKSSSSVAKTKPVLALLDKVPALSQSSLALARELSLRYGCSQGEAIEVMLPEALRGKKPSELSALPVLFDNNTLPAETWLCHDLGREGRWPFILEKIRASRSKGQGVIFLVPENHWVEPVRRKLAEGLKEPILTAERKVSPLKELEQWQAIREGKIGIIIGTRSAVFAPFNRLGLIVIWEEENPAYKQEQSPAYHAVTVAGMRREVESASVLIVSSSPTAVTYREAEKEKVRLVRFPAAKLAPIQPIDLTNYKQRSSGAVSFPLQNSINETLAKGGRVVLFFNRRGFAAVTRCNQCGFVVRCPRCEVNLVYRFEKKKLVCHLCAHESDLPNICPQCKGSYLRSLGAGVEKIESDLSRFFPQAHVARFDRDSVSVPDSANIIVATQAVLRIIDDIKPELIGVLDFDAQLNRADFRSGEQAFALLLRFAQAARDKVVVQTNEPGNYCLAAIVKGDIAGFYKKELSLRRELRFPPFTDLLAITVRGIDQAEVGAHARALQDKLVTAADPGVEIFEVQPDYVPKLRDKYRFTIMLKCRNVRKTLIWLKPLLKQIKRAKVIVTLNVEE